MPDSQHTAATVLLTKDEVIDLLLQDAALRRAAATCVLPAIRVGDSWRFRRADLDAWIARQRSPAVSH
jgi:excisionase family DNA binding protein